MDPNRQAKELAKLRQRRAWYLSLAEEYESGGPEAGTENGIVAAMRCADMAAHYRRMADDISVFIDAYADTETNA
jgi:hypothetical protein